MTRSGSRVAVILDWTNTLADERDLDSAVCRNMEMLIAQRYVKTLEWGKERYESVLESLKGTWKWYSYSFHGTKLGVDWRRAQTPELHRLRLFKETRPTLDYCSRMRWLTFLSTNAALEVIKDRLKWVGLESTFDGVVTSDMVRATKSEGRHLDYLNREFDLAHRTVYVVGDEMDQDIDPAAERGWRTILCLDANGMHRHGSQTSGGGRGHKPDFAIRNIGELPSVVGSPTPRREVRGPKTSERRQPHQPATESR